MSCSCKNLQIARGSTFSFTLSLPEEMDISDAKQVWVTFTQNGKEKINKSIEDVTIDVNKIIVTLTQEETLSLHTGSAEMQTRILTHDDTSLVQYPIIDWEVVPILKEGVIK